MFYFSKKILLSILLSHPELTRPVMIGTTKEINLALLDFIVFSMEKENLKQIELQLQLLIYNPAQDIM
jgi:hypothetical protein